VRVTHSTATSNTADPPDSLEIIIYLQYVKGQLVFRLPSTLHITSDQQCHIRCMLGLITKHTIEMMMICNMMKLIVCQLYHHTNNLITSII